MIILVERKLAFQEKKLLPTFVGWKPLKKALEGKRSAPPPGSD
jgi:hypothetical protein